MRYDERHALLLHVTLAAAADSSSLSLRCSLLVCTTSNVKKSDVVFPVNKATAQIALSPVAAAQHVFYVQRQRLASRALALSSGP